MASKVDTEGLKLSPPALQGILDNLDRRRRSYHRAKDIRSEIVVLEIIADLRIANQV